MDCIFYSDQTLNELVSTSSLSTSAKIITTDYKEWYCFKVQCSSPCRLNIGFFEYPFRSLDIFRTRGMVFFNQDIDIKKYLNDISDDFVINIEIIERNEENELEVYFDEKRLNQDKTDTNNKFGYRKAFKREEIINITSIFTKEQEHSHWKKGIIYREYIFSLIPLGKSEYSNGIIIFKFENDPAIESYVIELTFPSNPNELYNETFFYNYYGGGHKNYMPFPLYSRPLSIIRHRTLTFSNPYTKPNQKSKEIDYNESTFFYYFAMEKVNNSDSISNTLTINYYHVYRDIFSYISLNTLIIIKPDQQHNANSFDSIKRTLYSNDLPNTTLIMQFYQCAYNGDLHYKLYYKSQQSEDSYISRRTQLLRNNYGVEYNIEINGENTHEAQQFELLFSYSYADTSLVNSLFNEGLNTNYTIGYSIHGSSMSIYWNKYLRNRDNLIYKVYLNKLNNKDDQCSILMDYEPNSVLYSSDKINNNDDLVTYTFDELTKGVYRVNVMAQVNKTLYLTQVYDEVIIEITANTSSIRAIMVMMLIILGVDSLFLLYLINSQGIINTHVSTRSRSKSRPKN